MPQLTSNFEKWLARPMTGPKGLHSQIFTAAAYLLDDDWSDAEAYELLRHAANLVQDRTVPDREIHGAIDWARRKLSGEIDLNSPKWPERDDILRAEVVRSCAADMDRLKAGALRHETALSMLRKVYRADDLVCIGRTSFDFVTVRLRDIPDDNRDLGTCEFVNPSPMVALAGLTAGGKYSAHAKANTGPRVYAVVEFDDGQPHEHAAILKYLTRFLPLLMIVYSGKTSLHGWFPCPGLTDEQVRSFYAAAIRLGADPKMYGVSQFSRLPMGANGKTSRRQMVLYFNPAHTYHTCTTPPSLPSS